jgi:hypothetical protein
MINGKLKATKIQDNRLYHQVIDQDYSKFIYIYKQSKNQYSCE